MNGGGHFGLGALTFTVVSAAMGTPVTATMLMTAGIVALLPDVDVVLGIEHRKYTHTPMGASLLSLFVGASFFIAGVNWVAMVFVLLSHYAADFSYCKVLKRVVRNPTKNPVSFSEFIGTAVLSTSALSIVIVLVWPTTWIVFAAGLIGGLVGFISFERKSMW